MPPEKKTGEAPKKSPEDVRRELESELSEIMNRNARGVLREVDELLNKEPFTEKTAQQAGAAMSRLKKLLKA